jgi:hypothetical protein
MVTTGRLSRRPTKIRSNSMSKPLSGVTNQILLYAKGWYGKSGDIISDIRQIVSKYCMLEIQHIPEGDVWELLASTFAECVKNEHDVKEAIIDMLGKKWLGFNINFNRKPEDIIIGKLSIVHGEWVNKDEKMDFSLEKKAVENASTP